MTELLSVWSQADSFLASGGSKLTIENPTEEQLADYVLQIKQKQASNTDLSLTQNFNIALYALYEAVKPDYPERVVIVSLDSQNICNGAIFYYHAIIDGIGFYWIEGWAQVDNSGAAHVLSFLVGAKAAENNVNVQWNPAPNFKDVEPGSRYGINGYKDADTKWHVLTPKEMLAMADLQKDLVAQTEYFSKVFQDNLSWYFNPQV
jgi:hypothetical protein